MGIMGITAAGESPQRPESEMPGIATTPPTRVVGDLVAAAVGFRSLLAGVKRLSGRITLNPRASGCTVASGPSIC